MQLKSNTSMCSINHKFELSSPISFDFMNKELFQYNSLFKSKNNAVIEKPPNVLI